MKSKKPINDKYTLVSTEKRTASNGQSYFHCEVISNETGEVEQCRYFGNTRPKRVLDIVEKTGKNGVYRLAIIQPHTSRDKKTGRFVKTINRHQVAKRGAV